jgi:hypothetical protein
MPAAFCGKRRTAGEPRGIFHDFDSDRCFSLGRFLGGLLNYCAAHNK